MEIRKVYKGVNPEFLFDELKDFIQEQGATLDESKMQSYSNPLGTVHMSRGNLVFKMQGTECLRAHIVGSAAEETKMILDIDEKAFPQAKISEVERDLDFILGSYEVREPRE